MKMEGMQELVRNLIEMGKVDPKSVRHIVKNAGQRIISDAKARASFSKSISKSIGFISKNDGQYPTSVLIGPQYPGGNLAHFFEFGTAPRFASGGRRRGQIKARPFMRPAFDANVKGVDSEIKKKLMDLINKKAKQNNLK